MNVNYEANNIKKGVINSDKAENMTFKDVKDKDLASVIAVTNNNKGEAY